MTKFLKGDIKFNNYHINDKRVILISHKKL
jgi:hypothetical protein